MNQNFLDAYIRVLASMKEDSLPKTICINAMYLIWNARYNWYEKTGDKAW